MNKIDELKAALEAATPGVWTSGGAPKCGYGWIDAEPHLKCTFGQRRQIMSGQYGCMADDAAFIALAHNLMPALLEAVDTLKAIRARINGEFDSPELVRMGPLLADTQSDVVHFCNVTLEKFK